MTCTVYGLYSTKDGLIRYIGQTTKPLRTRVRQHVQTAIEGGDWPVAKWIRKLLRNRHTLECVALVEGAEWNTSEVETIARYRAEGFPLLNATAGGEGFTGHVLTPTHRAKLSAAAKRRAATPEGRAHLHGAARASWEGHVVKPRRTLSEAAKAVHERDPSILQRATEAGKIKTPAHREKLAAATKELWRDPAYKAAMKTARAGAWSAERREAQSQRMNAIRERKPCH